MSTPTIQSGPSIAAGILSYLVPGLGQIYQGRVSKGLMFMICLLGMFIGGQALGDWRNVYFSDEGGPNPANNPRGRSAVNALINRWHYAGQFWIGIAAWPAIWQYYNMPVPDAREHPFWHNYQRVPDNQELNTFLTNSDKTPELAWVYTVIAGMLNILVIYDAFAGPAHGDDPTPKPREN